MRLNVWVLLVSAAFSGVACSSSNSMVDPESTPLSAVATPNSEPSPSVPAASNVGTVGVPDTSDPPASAPNASDVADSTTDSVPVDRPFDVFVPSGYDAAKPTPLVLLLHGYSASGAIQEAYFGLQPSADKQGFLLVHPDGTKNARGDQFWNATNACCGFRSEVDDSAYLMALIHQVEGEYNVDPKRIFLIGHSNGGFMSYRMACDHADTIAAIVSLAGATFADTSTCDPSEPVSVLQIHGTDDDTIKYDGGAILGESYPSAETSVATWAAYDGCATTSVASNRALDIASNIEGAETSEQSFPGCPPGVDVELWTVPGGPHVPPLSSSFATDTIDFLLSHPKP